MKAESCLSTAMIVLKVVERKGASNGLRNGIDCPFELH
jgi:hypothetical protein